jgi:hypothetical protein
MTRTFDGVLHVVYTRKSGTKEELRDGLPGLFGQDEAVASASPGRRGTAARSPDACNLLVASSSALGETPLIRPAA